MEGTVLFNGEKLTKKIKKRVGYVLQVCFLSICSRSLFPSLNSHIDSQCHSACSSLWQPPA